MTLNEVIENSGQGVFRAWSARSETYFFDRYNNVRFHLEINMLKVIQMRNCFFEYLLQVGDMAWLNDVIEEIRYCENHGYGDN